MKTLVTRLPIKWKWGKKTIDSHLVGGNISFTLNTAECAEFIMPEAKPGIDYYIFCHKENLINSDIHVTKALLNVRIV